MCIVHSYGSPRQTIQHNMTWFHKSCRKHRWKKKEEQPHFTLPHFLFYFWKPCHSSTDKKQKTFQVLRLSLLKDPCNQTESTPISANVPSSIELLVTRSLVPLPSSIVILSWFSVPSIDPTHSPVVKVDGQTPFEKLYSKFENFAIPRLQAVSKLQVDPKLLLLLLRWWRRLPLPLSQEVWSLFWILVAHCWRSFNDVDYGGRRPWARKEWASSFVLWSEVLTLEGLNPRRVPSSQGIPKGEDHFLGLEGLRPRIVFRLKNAQRNCWTMAPERSAHDINDRVSSVVRCFPFPAFKMASAQSLPK